ncbi:MAG: PKD domain-containing protein, partial [Candidatus Thermoplasmatota archaeon]|nr:PKD domain-containing protein [Candidatus Thermoplasmatota archaeon]
FSYEPDDNSRLYWIVIPDDGTVRGWCRNGPRMFTTNINYPVEVDLILPPDGSVVPGPDVKLVWYGRDLDFEQVLYSVWLEHDGETTRLVGRWDDPAGPVLVVPDLVPGETYIWWVEGDNPFSPKGVSDRWSFTVASDGVPVAQLEDEQFDLDGVTLFWSPSLQGVTPDHYDVHLVDHTGGDTLLIAGTGNTSLSFHGLVEDTTYHWYVIPYDADGGQGHSVPTFRTFLYDVNSPPTVTIPADNVTVAPGQYVLEWSGHDPDGDVITYDVYMDPVNGTDLLMSNTSAVFVEVTLDPDRMYFWRVVSRDARSIGSEARGVVVTGPEGVDIGASGRLLAPADGATLAPPVVNLTWQAHDPLGRTLLYHIYIDTEGGDPVDSPPLVVNATMDWFILEVEEDTVVSWAVEVQPLRGPVSFLGSATFTALTLSIEAPTAVLAVAGQPAGTVAEVEAYKVVAFDANGSSAPLAAKIEYHFDYGDGTASGWVDRLSVEHTYLVVGVYNATLIVRDVDNRTSSPVVVVVTVRPGEKSSEDSVPGPTGAMGAIAILAAALLV